MTLAEDLVQAVFDRLCPPEDHPAYTPSEIESWRRDSRLAVVAVLHTLREHGIPLNRVDLRHLIEVVNRG